MTATKSCSRFTRRPVSTAYHVVYFTELEDGERDAAIDAAMSGASFFNGFINAADGPAAKTAIREFVARLNQGVTGTREELARLLTPFPDTLRASRTPGQTMPAAVNPASTALIFLSLIAFESFLKSDLAA